MYRYIFLAILTLNLIYDIILSVLSDRQKNKPLPENVRDVYDEAEYKRWRAYSAEHKRVATIDGIISFALLLVMFGTNVFSWLYNLLPGTEFWKNVLLMAVFTLFTSIVSIPASCIRTFGIEEKYGFNKSTVKTFVADEIKGLIINMILNCLLVAAVYAIGRGLTWEMYLGYLIGAVAFLGIFSMLSNVFQKIFNKFTPLPEGELRDTLTEMFAAEGYKLKNIYVMDASRRTTKVNAYCTGLGKLKRIVLFDNLVNNYTPGEITAVFAHELAHFKHRDTLKLTLCSYLNVAVIISAVAVFALFPEISMEYGFDGANMAFALISLLCVIFTPVLKLIALPVNAFSRSCERRADTFATRKGYGESMISALKKLSKDNLTDLNPHPFVVKVEHS
ncbi:MAG: M48 family metallopeptidase, partial [Clostridia bacterium]|nr:M48 family metallopeptidase [Clostridia bacterium]